MCKACEEYFENQAKKQQPSTSEKEGNTTAYIEGLYQRLTKPGYYERITTLLKLYVDELHGLKLTPSEDWIAKNLVTATELKDMTSIVDSILGGWLMAPTHLKVTLQACGTFKSTEDANKFVTDAENVVSLTRKLNGLCLPRE